MPRAAPLPLPENHAFAFVGERLEPARVLRPADAERLRRTRNATGKSNSDVLREFIGLSAAGDERRVTTVDFPLTMTPAEAALYTAPFEHVTRQGLTPHGANIDESLRSALARLERFLACPAATAEPVFAWIEGDVLPDDSLIVWARDDDFSAAVLYSRAFSLWSTRCGGPLSALRSFPFPWPPATPLSALNRAQEDLRFALGRAARAEDFESIESSLAAAYGWSSDLDDGELLLQLTATHAARARL